MNKMTRDNIFVFISFFMKFSLLPLLYFCLTFKYSLIFGGKPQLIDLSIIRYDYKYIWRYNKIYFSQNGFTVNLYRKETMYLIIFMNPGNLFRMFHFFTQCHKLPRRWFSAYENRNNKYKNEDFNTFQCFMQSSSQFISIIWHHNQSLDHFFYCDMDATLQSYHLLFNLCI